LICFLALRFTPLLGRKSEDHMWIQMIKMRLKPGKESELGGLSDALLAVEQPNSGLIRSTTTRDQKDPSSVYSIVVFESEEQARARERDPRRQEGLAKVRAFMEEMFDGPPEFLDLDVVAEHSGR
jgi:quinol monooxygenase YgiN